MTADLVAFLRARLDEDEQIARDPAATAWTKPDSPSVFVMDDGELVAETYDFAATRHIARHDPARVLAEVAAKREVLRLTERAHDYGGTFMNGFATAMEGALRLFAVAYADHPDYREEWRP